MRARDWSKEKVGMLQPLYMVGSSNGAVWRCRCDCGNEVDRKSSSLTGAKKRGFKNTSCGCMKSNQTPELNKAKEEGRDRYFTGVPCKHGHLAERRVRGRQCVECARLKDLETRGSRLEYFKQYQKDNPEKSKAAAARYNESNRDKRRMYDAEKRKCPEHKRKRSAWQRVRNHAKRSGSEIISRHEIDKIYDLQRGRCAHCNKKISSYHVDHIRPLSRGGSNNPENLQILCPACNLKKGAKDPYDWAKENGKLL